MKLSEKYPEPHAKYVVIRDGVVFTATPCYGMHKPWWVVRVMGDAYEVEPEPMIESDEWYPLAEFVSAQQSVEQTGATDADKQIADLAKDLEEAGDMCPRCRINNPLGRLRSLGLIEYPQPGSVVALPVLFLE